MKIFNLRSKKLVVGWSVVAGSMVNYFVNRESLYTYGCIPSSIQPGLLTEASVCRAYGWPFKIYEGLSANQSAIIFDLAFWVFGVWIILSLVSWRIMRAQNSKTKAKIND